MAGNARYKQSDRMLRKNLPFLLHSITSFGNFLKQKTLLFRIRIGGKFGNFFARTFNRRCFEESLNLIIRFPLIGHN